MSKIRWYHWAIYRVFRWAWNPLLRDRPGTVLALSKHMTLMSPPVSQEDEAAIDELVRRQVGSLRRPQTHKERT